MTDSTNHVATKQRRIRRLPVALAGAVVTISLMGCVALPAAEPVPMGSGCTPSTQGPLPDGSWLVVIDSNDEETITYDLVCWYTGDDANLAAAQDGITDLPVPNDHYTRNSSTWLRTQAYSDFPNLVYMPNAATYDAVAPSDAAAAFGSNLVWLYVIDGAVAAAVQQYIP